MRIRIDDRIILKDKRSGTVQYIGCVKFSRGEWYGITLDDSFAGKNDGEVRGKRYFKCAKNKGIFVKKDKILRVLPRPRLSSLRRSSTESLSVNSPRASLSRVESQPNRTIFKVGERVQCENRVGTVRWIGMLGTVSYIGVELDIEFQGKNNGCAMGKQYFNCRARQGIFWKPEWVQHWLGIKSPRPKKKSAPANVKLKRTPVTVMVTNDDVPKSRARDNSKKSRRRTSKTSSFKRQSSEPLLRLRSTATTPLPTPTEIETKKFSSARKSVPNIPIVNSRTEVSLKRKSGVSKRRSFRSHQLRGLKSSTAHSFIHSSFSKSPRHFRNPTEPLLNWDYLSRSSSRPKIKHQRSRSLRSLDINDIVYEGRIAEFVRTYEEKKREKNEVNGLSISEKRKNGSNPIAGEDIQQLKQTLEIVEREKRVAETAKIAAENSKNKMENQWKELKAKLAKTDEDIRKARDLFNEEKKQFQDDKSNFCLEKAELESSRRRLENEVQAKDEQLLRLTTQYGLAQKELSRMRVKIAEMNNVCTELRDARSELASIKMDLHYKEENEKKLKKELEFFRRRSLTEIKEQVRERKSVHEEGNRRSEEFGEIDGRRFETGKPRQESDMSSPHLSTDSQDLDHEIDAANTSNFLLLNHKRSKIDEDDNLSTGGQSNNFSDSTWFSEDTRKRHGPADILSEISSVNESIDHLRCLAQPEKQDPRFFGSSLTAIESADLSPTATVDSNSNGDFGSPKFDRRISARGEEIDGEENSQTENATRLEAPRRETKDGADSEIKVPKANRQSQAAFLSPAESVNNLFNYSESLNSSSSEAPAREKHRPKSHLSPREKKVMRRSKLRRKSFGAKKRSRKTKASQYYSDSSDGDTLNFGSMGSEKPLYLDFKADQQAGDSGSSEGSKNFPRSQSQNLLYESSSRQQNYRRVVSEGQLHERDLLRESLVKKKNSAPQQFLSKSPRTTAYFQANLMNSFNSEFNHFETTLEHVRDWITRTRDEISNLKTNPSTFDEIETLFGPQRLKQIKQKVTEVRNLIEKWEDVEVTWGEDFNPGRSRELLKLARGLEQELKKVEKDLTKKIDIVAFEFPKRLPGLLSEYWKKAQRVRRELEQIQHVYNGKTHPRYKAIGELRSDLKEIERGNAKVKLLKDNVDHVRKFGDFLGKFKTYKKSETQDCLHDAMNLVNIYESISRTIEEMRSALKKEYIKLERRGSRKNRNKLGSPSRYLEVVDWSELNMNAASQEPQKNW